MGHVGLHARRLRLNLLEKGRQWFERSGFRIMLEGRQQFPEVLSGSTPRGAFGGMCRSGQGRAVARGKRLGHRFEHLRKVGNRGRTVIQVFEHRSRPLRGVMGAIKAPSPFCQQPVSADGLPSAGPSGGA